MAKVFSLIGAKVVEVEGDDEELALKFQDDRWLSIWNSYEVRDSLGSRVDPKVLVGKQVQDCFDVDLTFRLVFDDNLDISVDLGNEAFRGPEAMVLQGGGGPTIVWN